jgi:type IV pilus assembly protein PilN
MQRRITRLPAIGNEGGGMKIALNLASQPFRRDRPMIVATVALSVVLGAMLILLVTLIVMERNDLASARNEIARLERDVAKLSREQAQVEAELRKPENAQVLERSLFLNSLLYRKGVSWTQIFMDLEKTVPHNVRIISIRPYITGRNQVMLDMTAGADQTEPLLKLLIALENSDLFGKTTVTSRQPPSQNEPLFRYKVQVNYGQQL